MKAIAKPEGETSFEMPVIFKPLWWQEKGLQQTASGYGSKLATPYMTTWKGHFRRVYAICYANAATHYVIIKGVRVIVELERE